MTDTAQLIGTILADDPGRDAVHIAVLPAVAGEDIQPGSMVKLRGDAAWFCHERQDAIGIADPFIQDRGWISKGSLFYVFLWPGSVTSLRHVWEHPNVVSEDGSARMPGGMTADEARAHLEEWLRAAPNAPDLQTYLDAVTGGDYDDDYLTIYGQDASGEIPAEVWEWTRIVVGRPLDTRPKRFTCSC